MDGYNNDELTLSFFYPSTLTIGRPFDTGGSAVDAEKHQGWTPLPIRATSPHVCIPILENKKNTLYKESYIINNKKRVVC